ncbi:MAG: NAD(P)H-hydrate dehydratase [Bacteroidales bacterium]|nr:NAD(P)H-hydrate dehydratase [Bacteroidales bacterium]
MNTLRNQDTTKHDYGHALLVAGAHGHVGCAILAARAALRSGCGLLTVHLPERCVDPMQAAFPEAMVSIDPSPVIFTTPPQHLDRYAAIAVGPGLGTDSATSEALHQLLTACCMLRPASLTSELPAANCQLLTACCPLILDADALNILAMHREWLPLAQGAVVTPHAREYQRLFGDLNPAEAAVKYHLTIVSKAHRTQVCSPDGSVYVNNTGNAGMATAGSGDVLTGILLGMLCSNHLHASVYDIVCKAVEIHGKIGDLAIEKQSESSLIASDLVDNLRFVSTDITEY